MSIFFEGELNSKVKEFRDRRDGRLADRGLKFQISHCDDESQVSDNGWVTIKGTHVLIDKDGNVKNGPGGLNGKRFNKATSTHFGTSAHNAAKEKHILEDTGMTKEMKGWLDEYEKAEDYEGVKKVENKIIDKLESMKPGDSFVYNDYTYVKQEDGKFKTEFSPMEFPAEDVAPMAITYLSGISFLKSQTGKYQKVEGLNIEFKEGNEEKIEDEPVDDNNENGEEKAEGKEIDNFMGIYDAAKKLGDLEGYGVKDNIIAAVDAFPVGTVVTYNGIDLTKHDDGNFYSPYDIGFTKEEIYSLCKSAYENDIVFSVNGEKAVSPEVKAVQDEFDNVLNDIKDIGLTVYSKNKLKKLFSDLPIGTEFKLGDSDEVCRMALDNFGDLAVWNDGEFYEIGDIAKTLWDDIQNNENGSISFIKLGEKKASESSGESGESEENNAVESSQSAMQSKQKVFDFFIEKNKDNPEKLKAGIVGLVDELPVGTELKVNNGHSTVIAVVGEENGEKVVWYNNMDHSTYMIGVKVKNCISKGGSNPIQIMKWGDGESSSSEPAVKAESEKSASNEFKLPEGENHWAKMADGDFVNLETGEVASASAIPDGDLMVGDYSDDKGFNVGSYVSGDNYKQHQKNTKIHSILSSLNDGDIKSIDAMQEISSELGDIPTGTEIKVGNKTFKKKDGDSYEDENGYEVEGIGVGGQIISQALYFGHGLKYEQYVQSTEKKGKKSITDKIKNLISNPEGKDSYALSSEIAKELDALPVGSVVSTGKSEYVKKKDGSFKNKVTSNQHNSEIIADFMQKAGSGTEFVKKIGDGYVAPTVNFGEPVNNAGQPAEKTKFTEAPTKASLKKIKVDESKYTQERKDNAFWDSESKGKDADDLMRAYTGSIWKSAPDEVKSSANWYTGSGYQGINEALREGKYTEHGDGYYDEHIDRITDLIEQSSYDKDIWLQRGVSLKSAASLFGMKKADLENFKYGNGTAEELLEILKGKNIQDNAFQSCGSAKGTGFDSKPIIMNVYCPAGTKMIYAEPWSSCGNGSGKSWDGESSQSNIGGEAETILQRGTVYRPTKVSLKYGKIYVDVEVISQGHYIHSKKS